MLPALLILASQQSPLPGFWEGRTPLEYGMGLVILSLAGTCGILWKWGNDIRRETALKFEQIAEERKQEQRDMIENMVRQTVALERVPALLDDRSRR